MSFCLSGHVTSVIRCLLLQWNQLQGGVSWMKTRPNHQLIFDQRAEQIEGVLTMLDETGGNLETRKIFRENSVKTTAFSSGYEKPFSYLQA